MAAVTRLAVSEPTTFASSAEVFAPLQDLIRRIHVCQNLMVSAPGFRTDLDQKRGEAMIKLAGVDRAHISELHAGIVGMVALIEKKLVLTDTEKLDLLAKEIRKCVNTEGLFRLCGTRVGITSLLGDFSSDAVEDIKDVHTLTGAFKQILREQNPSLLDAIKSGLLAEDLTIEKLKPLIQSLRDKEKAELKIVLDLLSEIAVSAETNKMNAANLATCIAPNLHTPAEGLAALGELGPMNAAVEMMIENNSELFE